ncbi:MAG TPA: PspC domain-containing protein [Actinomycetota bacterium]|nr:PspC domain-containing protein [Actinomycetota bacterium]
MQVSRRAPALFGSYRPVRSADNRMLAGVGAGLAEWAGVDPALVRAGFVVLTLAGGAGVAAYLFLWAVSAPSRERQGPSKPLLPGHRQVAAVACITAGLLVAARDVGLWLGDGVVWPVAIAALGASVIWVRGDVALRGWPGGRTTDASPFSTAGLLRLGIGGALVMIGVAAVLAANTTFTLRRAFDLLFPLLVVVTGIALILGPWLASIARQMTEDRRERIRSQERSEMAAHLHDSVLQTLALIQRTSSVKEMATLARVQERELRAWLYGKGKTLDVHTLDAAIDVVAGRVETMHQVTVETVVVGDARLDDRLGALVHACGEAMINAARHSGEESISVYVEVEESRATAYVRDQGRGFDPASVAPDRRGIADSIVGRLRRFGGTATISSAPGEGTEVRLVMPL